MGTMTPSWSAQRSRDVHQAGGVWVEAPVSGSRGPAEAGELVAMLAGEAEALDVAREIIRPCCRDMFDCGAVPNALRMKLAVNLFLITLVTGLVEATHFAQRAGLDLEVFRAMVGAGPMSSAVSRGKLDKLLAQDFSVQASIRDVLKNSRLVEAATVEAGALAPLISQCTLLYERATELGLGDRDMAAVLGAFEKT
jgi:3-hydroxyisobutyrate dehydrogenase